MTLDTKVVIKLEPSKQLKVLKQVYLSIQVLREQSIKLKTSLII